MRGGGNGHTSRQKSLVKPPVPSPPDYDSCIQARTEHLPAEAQRYVKLFQLVTHLSRADEEFQLRNLVLMTFFLHLLEGAGYLRGAPHKDAAPTG